MALDSQPVPELPNGSAFQSASVGTPSKSPSPYAIISKDCIPNKITGVLRGIKAASTNDPQKHQEVLSWSVHRAIYNGKTDILRHLLDHEGVASRNGRGSCVDSTSTILFEETFKLLQSRGAQLGPRTLHYTASAAASHHDDKYQAIRMAVVTYLADEVGLDVNAMDFEGQLTNHVGTPLCYACHGDEGGEAVRFQLDRGADPSIKDYWGIHDALTIAFSNQITQYLRCFIYG